VFQIQSKSSLRTALLLGAATASAMSLSSAAMAQQAPVETVVVTGVYEPVAIAEVDRSVRVLPVG